MSEQKTYRVTVAALSHVPISTNVGPALGMLYAGDLLPLAVPQDKIDAWLEAGYIEEVGVAPAASEPVKAAQEGPVRPPEHGPGSGKAAWVEYATAQGMDRAEAEAMKPTELIARFPADGDEGGQGTGEGE